MPLLFSSLLTLTSCVPQALEQGDLFEVELPAHDWGGLPFDMHEKQRALAQAVSKNRLVQLRQPVQFASRESGVHILGAEAVYRVDARAPRPIIEAGFVVRLQVVEEPLPPTIELTNLETRVSQTYRLTTFD